MLSQYPTGHKSCDNEEVHPLQTKQPIKKTQKNEYQYYSKTLKFHLNQFTMHPV